MESTSSLTSSNGKIGYNQIQGEEQYDFNNTIHRKQNTRWHRILICFLSFTCLSLIAFIISTHRLGDNRQCSCSHTNDVGSDLLVNDGLSIINKIAIPYHYLEPNLDVDDFAVSDSHWSNLFPGKILLNV